MVHCKTQLCLDTVTLTCPHIWARLCHVKLLLCRAVKLVGRWGSSSGPSAKIARPISDLNSTLCSCSNSPKPKAVTFSVCGCSVCLTLLLCLLFAACLVDPCESPDLCVCDFESVDVFLGVTGCCNDEWFLLVFLCSHSSAGLLELLWVTSKNLCDWTDMYCMYISDEQHNPWL